MCCATPQRPPCFKRLRRASERAFCTDSFLSGRALEGISDLRRQFQQLLAEAGFLSGGRGRGSGGNRAAAAEAANAHSGAWSPNMGSEERCQ